MAVPSESPVPVRTQFSPSQSQGIEKYIAIGCLVLLQTDIPIEHELWSLPGLEEWRHLTFPTDSTKHERQRLGPQSLEQILLTSKSLIPYRGLMENRWICMAFASRLGQDCMPRGIVRVYLLPEDVDHRLVPRNDAGLRKARLQLLSRLDFSESTWKGDVGGPAPATLQPDVDGEVPRESLLQMFNSIPSPEPRPDLVQDPDAQQCICMLLESKVPGLKSELYPYQRRSAAVMLEKEVQPEQTLDPRLVASVDQNGRIWFHDAANGTGFKEPRYYDGASGGILAEQMGSGKTLICLALILATRHQPSHIPDIYRGSRIVRRQVGSLADMAAACVTQNAIPWKMALQFDDLEYTSCIDAIQRNRGCYDLPRPPPRRVTRRPVTDAPPTKVYSSHASLVVVPTNLVQQWKNEIAKHTSGLEVLVMNRMKDPVPPVDELLKYDIIIFSYTRFERLLVDGAQDANGTFMLQSPIASIHFKRCIVDEGHKLGNSTSGTRSNLQLVLDCLQITSRWIVTGTPSKGLYGVDESTTDTPVSEDAGRPRLAVSSAELEKDDLKRIGSIATLYLKVRPWANAPDEPGDTPADWNVYVMQPHHSRKSSGRKDCLKATLESLIVRHRLSEIGDLLPEVDEKTVYLDGSYQDILCLNLFSMVIIFNAVQSQRVDQDYFFHPRQRKSLMQLVSNLRQASFFGGSFFSREDIERALETATEFLREGKVQISPDDEKLLREAISFGQLASASQLKGLASLFHEIPIYVQHFPGGLGAAWSLDGSEGDPVCTDSRMIFELQKFLQSSIDAPNSLHLLFTSGRFEARGREEREKALATQEPARPVRRTTLAGNTQPGQDHIHASPSKRKSPYGTLNVDRVGDSDSIEVAEPLAKTQLISTVSAKLSYLVDQIVQHQHQEQMIIFYENENVAYYLAGMLEILQVHHLIYAKTITPERRAQYVTTFNQNPKFRVLLMDITQAAFGLDMRSASRIYFINPVLNPQVEAQAIGRARRISQQKPVTVETLVLRGSIEEVIVRRRSEMSQAEQRKCRSILDDKPIYEWILKPRMLKLPDAVCGGDQTALLRYPQLIFGRGFGQAPEDPDRDLVLENSTETTGSFGLPQRKREIPRPGTPERAERSPKRRVVRFAETEDS